MADYIITKQKTNLSGGSLQVDSVKKAEVLTSSSVVVFESSVDNEFDVYLFLVKTVKAHGSKNIAVVSDEPSPLMDELVKALDIFQIKDSSVIYDTDLYVDLLQELDSRDDLNEDKWSTDTAVGYLREFEKSLEDLIPKQQKLVLGSIVDDLVDNGKSSDFDNEFRKQLRDMFDTFIVKMAYMEEQIAKVKEEQRDGVSASLMSLADNIQSYPPFTYTGTSKILLVKEMTPCMYLTSFLIALREFLTVNADTRTALLIIDRPSDFVKMRYGKYSHVNASTLRTNRSKLTLAKVLYTTAPTKTTLESLMEHRTDKVYIVLDRTYAKANIITGRGVKVINATSSYSFMRTNNLVAKDTIVNNVGANDQLLILSHLSNYKKDESTRIQSYITNYDVPMTKIANLLGIGGMLKR